jgi:hypothetical protein
VVRDEQILEMVAADRSLRVCEIARKIHVSTITAWTMDSNIKKKVCTNITLIVSQLYYLKIFREGGSFGELLLLLLPRRGNAYFTHPQVESYPLALE